MPGLILASQLRQALATVSILAIKVSSIVQNHIQLLWFFLAALRSVLALRVGKVRASSIPLIIGILGSHPTGKRGYPEPMRNLKEAL